MKRSEHTHHLAENHHCELLPERSGLSRLHRGPEFMRTEVCHGWLVNISKEEEKLACSLNGRLFSELVRLKPLNIRRNLDLVIQFGKLLDKRCLSLSYLHAQRLGP